MKHGFAHFTLEDLRRTARTHRAVPGPLMVGVTALTTGSTRAGLLSIIVLFAGGAMLLAHSGRTD